MSRDLSQGSFVIVANGFADGPSQALEEFIGPRAREVNVVEHPLGPEHPGEHRWRTWRGGRVVRRRILPFVNRPPLTFAADPLLPPLLPRADTWFGFNPLAAAQGLVHRRLRRSGQVVVWYVDFSPERFGQSPITRFYDAVDRWCVRRADLRIELSGAARDGRDARLGVAGARTAVVPMGAWLDRVPQASPAAWEARRMVYLGHLVERQGAELVIDALPRLRDDGVRADIIGDGPLRTDLERRADALGVGDLVTFHGFVEDHRDVEQLLAQATIGLAPYREDPDSFTRYADPGKIKAYLGAGLPILMTSVPPNAADLAEHAGAELLPWEPEAFARAVRELIADRSAWDERHVAARAYVGSFDWPVLLVPVLESLGWRV